MLAPTPSSVVLDYPVLIALFPKPSGASEQITGEIWHYCTDAYLQSVG
jgi:hypothetical protein